MINKKQVIFVTGFSETDGEGWPNWLAQKFTENGFEFKLLLMPDPMYPEVSEWVGFLKEQNLEINQHTYFVGHSLGCITIARFLETLPENVIAGGCIFVSGFCSLPKIPLLASFCILPLDFSEVRKHAREFVVISSDNDHYVPMSYGAELAGKLGAKFIVEPRKGHIESDIKKLPSALNSVLEMDQVRDVEEDIEELFSFKK